jgi:hypothetical protein
MPNPGSLFSCRGPKTYAVSWRTENQIINSSYHKNSPDPVEGYWITHNLECLASKVRPAYYYIFCLFACTFLSFFLRDSNSNVRSWQLALLVF